MHVTVNGTDQTELLREMGSLVLTADGDAVQIDGNTAPHLAAARNALAFAVAIALPIEAIEPFIDSLRTFARAKQASTN